MANEKKDRLMIVFDNFGPTTEEVIDYQQLGTCLRKLQVGVLVASEKVDPLINHAKCVGEQRNVGY